MRSTTGQAWGEQHTRLHAQLVLERAFGALRRLEPRPQVVDRARERAELVLVRRRRSTDRE